MSMKVMEITNELGSVVGGRKSKKVVDHTWSAGLGSLVGMAMGGAAGAVLASGVAKGPKSTVACIFSGVVLGGLLGAAAPLAGSMLIKKEKAGK